MKPKSKPKSCKTQDSTPTPIVDALCEAQHEPACGLIWADDARTIEREKAFYRDLLEQIALGSRKTQARRLATAGLEFWDNMQKDIP